MSLYTLESPPVSPKSMASASSSSSTTPAGPTSATTVPTQSDVFVLSELPDTSTNAQIPIVKDHKDLNNVQSATDSFAKMVVADNSQEQSGKKMEMEISAPSNENTGFKFIVTPATPEKQVINGNDDSEDIKLKATVSAAAAAAIKITVTPASPEMKPAAIDGKVEELETKHAATFTNGAPAEPKQKLSGMPFVVGKGFIKPKGIFKATKEEGNLLTIPEDSELSTSAPKKKGRQFEGVERLVYPIPNSVRRGVPQSAHRDQLPLQDRNDNPFTWPDGSWPDLGEEFQYTDLDGVPFEPERTYKPLPNNYANCNPWGHYQTSMNTPMPKIKGMPEVEIGSKGGYGSVDGMGGFGSAYVEPLPYTGPGSAGSSFGSEEGDEIIIPDHSEFFIKGIDDVENTIKGYPRRVYLFADIAVPANSKEAREFFLRQKGLLPPFGWKPANGAVAITRAEKNRRLEEEAKAKAEQAAAEAMASTAPAETGD